jgi:hypothetical protein
MSNKPKWSQEDYKNWPHQDYNDYIGDSGHLLIFFGFLELCAHKTDRVVYTLRMREHKGYPSIYQIIKNSVDEHDAAMKTCGDWHIWNRWKESEALYEGERSMIYKGTGLRHAIAAMEARRASNAMVNIVRRSEDGDYRASKDLVMWGVKKSKTGKKVEQVPESEEADIFNLASEIEKKKKK